MASSHFTALACSVQELKRIYLDQALAVPNPSPDQQEQARAFVAFAHAEFEYYVEEALRDLAGTALANAATGRYSKASMALLTFSGLSGLNGGSVLSSQKKKTPRQIATRFGEAHAALLQVLNANNGAREKHLAAMAIPLGLDVADVDNTWLNDLDAFCSFRGAFVHMSRTTQRGSHLAVNPHDMWAKCRSLVWTNPQLARQGTISSFESFDLWVENEKQSFGPTITMPSWKLSVLRFLSAVLWDIRSGRRASDQDE